MKRDFLKELGLEAETIETIMAEYGKTIAEYKTNIETEQQKIKTFEEQKKANDDLIAQLQKDNQGNADLQTAMETLKQQREADKQAYEDKIKGIQKEKDDIEYDTALKALFDPVPFASNLAKKAAIADFNADRDKRTIKDGKFVDGEDFIEELMNSEPDAFKQVDKEDNEENEDTKTTKFYTSPDPKKQSVKTTKDPLPLNIFR